MKKKTCFCRLISVLFKSVQNYTILYEIGVKTTSCVPQHNNEIPIKKRVWKKLKNENNCIFLHF